MRSERYRECVALLEERQVSLESIADCVIFLHKRYDDDITQKRCLEVVDAVLEDPDIQNALIVSLELDILAEEGNLRSEAIKEAMMKDEGLFGVDELMGLGMAFNYGPIAITSFGYIDKVKPGIIGILNDPKEGTCNTFIDDVVGAIAACASSLLAHERRHH